MTTSIDRLIIFGDSLSDIGVKRNTHTGRFASLFGFMRTNQVNRYSDNRNWTDFLWEWAGGTPLIVKNPATSEGLAKPHLTWSDKSVNGSRPELPIFYVNYGEGGARGGSDQWGVGLGTFKEQAERYLEQLAATKPKGNGLYLVWFGLNDLVTNGRDPNDMKTVAKEMGDICEAIGDKDPDAYFIFGNLPNPQGAVRFLTPKLAEVACGYQTGAFEYGHALAQQVSTRFAGHGAVLDIYTAMEHVDRNVPAYGLTTGAQPPGVPVRYGALADPKLSFFTTTSDEAHPTEEVYKLIAKLWAEKILADHDLGVLRQSGEGRFEVRGDK